MTRITLHIGPDAALAARLAQALEARRDALAARHVLVPRSLASIGPNALALAAGDTGDPETASLELDDAARSRLRRQIAGALRDEIAAARPDRVVICAARLADLLHPGDIAALRDMLAPLADAVEIVAHVDDPARLFAARYAAQVMAGRQADPRQELSLLSTPDLRAALIAARPVGDPRTGVVPVIEGAPVWLDLPGLARVWAEVFGAVRLRSASDAPIWGDGLAEEVRATFALDAAPDPLPAARPPVLPSAAWLSRARRFNVALARLCAREGYAVPMDLRRRLLAEMSIPGPPVDSGSLHAMSDRLAPDMAALNRAHEGIEPAHLAPDPPAPGWIEADPERGFRATQYLLAFRPLIEKVASTSGPLNLSPAARAAMPITARHKLAALRGSAFAPHDALPPRPGATPVFPPAPAQGTGRTIVACMKNEAPYLLEWLAFHRALGFDGFLIYSNDCEDGTDAMLDRLDAMGFVQHRDNSAWRGNSPQQHALDRAMDEPLVREAGWVAHIDVDEFVNIQTGDGTLDALIQAVGDATHVAMTWRLFGHDGQQAIEAGFVTDRFLRAAPRHLPKPHTAWGFKTLGRNTGAYEKLSCHRPNKLRAGHEDRVRWVNGSGAALPDRFARRGWRNGRGEVGYDLVQLNHYALRSVDAFLVKRARGRALHVDRKIGLNYWLRMDWSDVTDRSILRHRPRLAVEHARLMADAALSALHRAGLDWHRAKAAALRAHADFAALREQALALTLAPDERAAWALVLDTES
ncbi:glycosyltransferase family 2 protein [Citreimonas salinaria]|uniref:Glycosyl transferase family 2 n=1 Tax=Citreimonas salinaria TaxID=321339 RepID=A0A1H3GDB8_9RHOB|nr:glycosyltransferase family 2 protein [Citreimonas salinaria]SDY00309.1 Glycosyl transferase family 2 [Citreimonas salinaria]